MAVKRKFRTFAGKNWVKASTMVIAVAGLGLGIAGMFFPKGDDISIESGRTLIHTGGNVSARDQASSFEEDDIAQNELRYEFKTDSQLEEGKRYAIKATFNKDRPNVFKELVLTVSDEPTLIDVAGVPMMVTLNSNGYDNVIKFLKAPRFDYTEVVCYTTPTAGQLGCGDVNGSAGNGGTDTTPVQPGQTIIEDDSNFDKASGLINTNIVYNKGWTPSNEQDLKDLAKAKWNAGNAGDNWDLPPIPSDGVGYKQIVMWSWEMEKYGAKSFGEDVDLLADFKYTGNGTVRSKLLYSPQHLVSERCASGEKWANGYWHKTSYGGILNALFAVRASCETIKINSTDTKKFHWDVMLLGDVVLTEPSAQRLIDVTVFSGNRSVATHGPSHTKDQSATEHTIHMPIKDNFDMNKISVVSIHEEIE